MSWEKTTVRPCLVAASVGSGQVLRLPTLPRLVLSFILQGWMLSFLLQRILFHQHPFMTIPVILLLWLKYRDHWIDVTCYPASPSFDGLTVTNFRLHLPGDISHIIPWSAVLRTTETGYLFFAAYRFLRFDPVLYCWVIKRASYPFFRDVDYHRNCSEFLCTRSKSSPCWSRFCSKWIEESCTVACLPLILVEFLQTSHKETGRYHTHLHPHFLLGF